MELNCMFYSIQFLEVCFHFELLFANLFVCFLVATRSKICNKSMQPSKLNQLFCLQNFKIEVHFVLSIRLTIWLLILIKMYVLRHLRFVTTLIKTFSSQKYVMEHERGLIFNKNVLSLNKSCR